MSQSPYFYEKVLWTLIIIFIGALCGTIIDGYAVSRGILWQGRLMADYAPLLVMLVWRIPDIMHWKPSEMYLEWEKEIRAEEEEKESKELLKELPALA